MESNPLYLQLKPAVVSYLLRDGKVTEDAFSQTLLGLANDGWLAIEPQDSGVPLVRMVRTPTPTDVKPFEQLALERVAWRMGGLTHVPISALTSNEGEDYGTWWTKFTDAVKQDAVTAGLARGFDPRSCLFALVSLATVPVFGVAVMSAFHWHGSSAFGAFYYALIPAFILFCLLSLLFRRSNLTTEGRAAAEWWRRNGGGLSGTLLTDRLPPGAAPSPHSPDALVAQGSEPLPPDHVWSSYGGTWRMVKVGSTDEHSWGKPGTLVGIVIVAAFMTVPAALIGHFAGGGLVRLIGLGPAALGALVVLGSWLPAHRRRQAFPERSTFNGQVVKRWTYETRGEDNTQTHYCCCIDDGTSPEGWSFEIGRQLYSHMRVGDIVYVDFSPRWHKVNEIQLAAPAPGAR